MSKLGKIRAELKAPKNLYNSFGKYKYRNCESICEAVKPLLEKYDADLVLKDEMVCIGERYYLKATAELYDEGGMIAQSFGFAREAEKKSGMDDSQISGTASSYARKYALNGLFLIDDTKDADTDEYHNETAEKAKRTPVERRPAPTPERIGEERAKAFGKLLLDKGVNIMRLLEQYNVSVLSDLTEEQHSNIVRKLNESKR